jgi:hypothetical protein
MKYFFSFLAFEGFDHGGILSLKDIIVKGYQIRTGKFEAEHLQLCRKRSVSSMVE